MCAPPETGRSSSRAAKPVAIPPRRPESDTFRRPSTWSSSPESSPSAPELEVRAVRSVLRSDIGPIGPIGPMIKHRISCVVASSARTDLACHCERSFLSKNTRSSSATPGSFPRITQCKTPSSRRHAVTARLRHRSDRTNPPDARVRHKPTIRCAGSPCAVSLRHSVITRRLSKWRDGSYAASQRRNLAIRPDAPCRSFRRAATHPTRSSRSAASYTNPTRQRGLPWSVAIRYIAYESARPRAFSSALRPTLNR